MSTRLRHLARVNPATPGFDRLPSNGEVTFLPLEAVWPGNRLNVDRHRPKDQVSVGYTRFQEGDILVPKITPTFQADRTVIVTGLSDGIGVGTTELHVVRVGPSAHPLYIRYLLSSKPFLDEGEASMIGVAGQKRVPDECLRDLIVPVTDARRQRAIADYLDAETARIDALIEKKQRMVRLIDERDMSLLSTTLFPKKARFAPLGYFASLQSGLTIDGNRDPGHDWVTRPYLRVANVQAGWLDLDDITEVVVPASLAKRCALRPGDVLMTEGGDLDKLGRGTIWEAQLPDCLHQNHIFAVRTDPRRLDSRFLALLTGTSHARRYFESTGVRTTNLASTNSSKILGLPVPVLPLDEQARMVDTFQGAAQHTSVLCDRLRRQIDLLAEHRQALITAAVTGEIDVPGVAA
jgi:type I restriction enzyme S subunit